MRDLWNREIDYIRISVTDRCNLRCVYCMPEEGIESISHDRILTFDEIARICRVMAQSGLKKIKLTGGEPLIRRGIVSLVRQLKEVPGIEQVTLTTNGILLEEMADDLVSSGIDAVTVSLDTLDRERFRQMTRRDELPHVLEGIRAMRRHPQIPLKINCLLQEPEKDLLAVANLARIQPIHVRFIEVMPIGYGRQMKFVKEEHLRELLMKHYGTLMPCGDVLGNGPAVYFSLEGFQGKIGFISAVSHKFCNSCNRVRLTSDGFLKTCLQYDTGVRLKEPMQAGCSDEELAALIARAIREKPVGHEFDKKGLVAGEEVRTMSQIGG